jgi:hypothetical protein
VLLSQTITFSTIPSQVAGTMLTLTATASSMLPVTYMSDSLSVCTISGATVSFIGAGTCIIVASQAGNTAYSAATPVTQSFTVTLQTQTITFTTIPSQLAGTTLTLSATASSQRPVSYMSDSLGVCTVSGNLVTLITDGTCMIVASQAGNTIYSAATSVTQSFAVTLQTQTITFGPIPSQVAGTTLAIMASASSKLPVTFMSETPTVCTVSGTTASFITGGTCTIEALQTGNTIYGAATPVVQSFQVTLQTQTITFSPISSQLAGTMLTLSATATSGLPVTFMSLTPSICTVSGTTASFITGGTCTIEALQTGNTIYGAATPVTQSFTVLATFSITPIPPAETIARGVLGAFVLQLHSLYGFDRNVTLSCSGGPAGSKCADLPQTVRLDGTALALSGILFPMTAEPGTYVITFTGVSGLVRESATAKFSVK